MKRYPLHLTIIELPYKLWQDLKCLTGRHYDLLDDGRCSWCERQTR